MFAAARLGAVMVNINYQWTVSQLDYVIRDCDVKALIVDSRRAKELNDATIADSVCRILVKGTTPDHPLMSPLNAEPSASSLPSPLGIDIDLAAILYTSGSTGSPKGVMLSHLNLIQGARSVSQYVENTPEDRLMSLLPLSFDYGLSQLNCMCMMGGTLVLQGVPMASAVVKTLAEQRITGLAAVPPIWIPLVRYLSQVHTPLPHLRYVTNSGGKIPPHTLAEMPKVLGGTKVFLMYGLTEAFRSTYLTPEKFAEKPGSMGQAIPNVETFVVDPAIGVCGPGQTGELVHRGSLISMGYWGKPEATAEKIRICPELRYLIGDEKVVYSGDLVRLDDDGDYWFVGRNDRMIKSSGFRISPTEVEDLVHQSGLVDQVIAFAADDELLGQVVNVIVSAVEGSEVDSVELKKRLQKSMPHYMVPKVIHVWTGAMLRTGSGKLDVPNMIEAVRGLPTISDSK